MPWFRSYRAVEGRGGACIVQPHLERQQGARCLGDAGTWRCIGFQKCPRRGRGPGTHGTYCQAWPKADAALCTLVWRLSQGRLGAYEAVKLRGKLRFV